MKVSIVTISYNQAQYLERALLSVIEQGHSELEFIVVDPGSEDGSREIIERHASRIDKIIFEPDDGPADGLNKGFRAAGGEVLGFLNSDDFLLPGAVGTIADAFSRYPEVDVISGHAVVVNENDQILRKAYSDVFSLQRFVYGVCILLQPSTYFRTRTYAGAGGFNSRNRLSWDAELFYNMALNRARFMRINSCLSALRVHSGSITSTKVVGGSARAERVNTLGFVKRVSKWYDPYAYHYHKLIRYLTNPLDVLERVKHGPIYGRTGSR